MLSPILARASGIVTVKGKLISMNAKEYEVETANNVYTISKAALTSDQVSGITRTEIPVSLQVPFEAVTHIKRLKKVALAPSGAVKR